MAGVGHLRRSKIEGNSVDGTLSPFQLELFSRYTASAQNLLPGSTEVRREYLSGFRSTPLSKMKTENTRIIYTQLAAKSKCLRYAIETGLFSKTQLCL